jgi:ADP-heptose:LPS heptosyltransferase
LLLIKNKHKFRKILIIQTASFGDVILATPVVEQLHHSFPKAAIDFLLKKGIEGIFSGHPFLNEVHIWDKNHNKYKNYIKIVRTVGAKRYDLVVNIQRFFTSGLITALSGAPEKSGFNKNPLSFTFTHKAEHVIGPKENPIHETERNLLLINKFCEPGPAKMKLYPGKKDYEAVADKLNAKFITISPASLWFTKQYPSGKWLELIRAMDHSTRIYLLGSKADAALCQELAVKADKNGMENLAGKLSFLQAAALMEKAVMNYVNDSAPMHLASAVNAPVAAVFCSTIPGFGFGPLSEKSVIIQTTENLACRPCGLHGKKACPEKHFRCALSIGFEQFVKVMEDRE